MRNVPLKQRVAGFSLVELMIALVISVFLIATVFVVVQDVRQSYTDRSNLSSLTARERFTVTLLQEIIQSAGYYPDPVLNPPYIEFPSDSATVPNAAGDTLNFAAGQAIYGLGETITVNGVSLPDDTIAVRYETTSGDGTPMCDGSSNNTGSDVVYTNYFYIQSAPNDKGGISDYLYCALQIGSTWASEGPIQLVQGVQSIEIWYGLASDNGGSYSLPSQYTGDANSSIDTYVPESSMTAQDWYEIRSVMLTIQFSNPSSAEAGQVNPSITYVINVAKQPPYI